MTGGQVLAVLTSCGVVLEPQGDKLHYRAPKGVLTPQLRQALTEHKAEIMTLLSRTACTCNPLPSQAQYGAMAQAGCGPDYACCSACGKTSQCKICRGCRYCRIPG